MHSTHLILVATAVSLTFPRLSQSQATGSVSQVPELTIYASGSATRSPDRATLTLSVVIDRPTAAEAAAVNAEIQQRVLDTLMSMGYTDADLQTTKFTVSEAPEYQRRDPNHPPVYRAQNTIRVNLTDLTRIGSTIDAALAVGATNVASVDFISTQAEEAGREAVADAAARARRYAESLATSMGGRVGELISIDNGSSPYASFGGRVGGLVVQTTPINTGDITYTARVTARWRFIPNP